MAFQKWDKSLSVGIKKIDIQHKGLLNLLNDLHQCVIRQLPKENLENILINLVLYTKTHFCEEELYMEEINHPLIAGHKKEHLLFLEKVTEFQSKLQNNKKTLSIEILVFLNNWLIDHIKVRDKEYAKKD